MHTRFKSLPCQEINKCNNLLNEQKLGSLLLRMCYTDYFYSINLFSLFIEVTNKVVWSWAAKPGACRDWGYLLS